MKKITIFLFLLSIPLASFAQTDDHTAREAAEGKAIWQKFQAKEMTCANMKNDDFEALGEYFMEQMHAVMGKRMSGCDNSAAYPASGAGFMPMMNMMMTGGMMGSNMMGYGNSAFGWFGGWFGSLLMIVWWAFVILGIVALIKWLTKK